jgi:hypothetical protein
MEDTYQTDLIPYLVQGDEIEVLLVELEDSETLATIFELTEDGKVRWTWWNDCLGWRGRGRLGDVEIRMTRFDKTRSYKFDKIQSYSIDALFEKYAYWRKWRPYFEMKDHDLDRFIVKGIHTKEGDDSYGIADSLYNKVIEAGESLR